MDFVRTMSERVEACLRCGEEFQQDLGTSCFRVEGVSMEYFEVKRTEEDVYELTLHYYVKNNVEDRTVVLKSRDLCVLVKSLFEFPATYSVCCDCGTMKRKDEACSNCEFFRLYCSYHESAETCCVCQEECFRVTLVCGHRFHLTCLAGIKPADAKCPVCRKALSEEDFCFVYFKDQADEEGY